MHKLYITYDKDHQPVITGDITITAEQYYQLIKSFEGVFRKENTMKKTTKKTATKKAAKKKPVKKK